VTVTIEHYVLDKDGNAVLANRDEWSEFMEHGERHVGYYEANGVRVSTVFLGVDHSFGFDLCPDANGKPILWETMVFGGLMDSHMERYTSIEAARQGHARILNKAMRLPMPGSLFTEKLNDLVRAHEVDPAERCAAIEVFLDTYYAEVEEKEE
jgi:hypothetical protein